MRVPDVYRISDVGKGWNAATTTLDAERQALSGGRKKRRPKDEILGGKTFDQVLELARRLGISHHPVVRDRLAAEYTKGRLLALTIQRGRAEPGNGPASWSRGSINKVVKASSNQSLQLLALDLLGATRPRGRSRTPASILATSSLRCCAPGATRSKAARPKSSATSSPNACWDCHASPIRTRASPGATCRVDEEPVHMTTQTDIQTFVVRSDRDGCATLTLTRARLTSPRVHEVVVVAGGSQIGQVGPGLDAGGEDRSRGRSSAGRRGRR